MRTKNQRWKILDQAFLSSVITVSLVEFSQVGSGLIDGVMTSRMLGSNAMAAVGLGYPLFSIAGVISGVLALGMQALSAKEIGRGNFKAFNEISSISLFVGGLLSLLFTAMVVCFSGPLASFLGAKGNSAELFEPTRQYILGLCVGIPPLIVSPILAPAIQLDNSGSLVRKASLIGAGADIVLDWLLVKLNLGIFGMGLATSIAQYVNFAILLTHFAKKDRMLRIAFKPSAIGTIPKVLSKGTNMAVRRLANVIRPILINNYIILLGGTAAMTALSVKNTVSNFADILGSGIVGTVPLMMGIVYGEKSLEGILHVGKQTHKAICIGTGAVAVLAAILASPISTFFVGNEPEVHGLAVFSIYMMSAELIAQTLIASRISYLNVISKFFDSQLLQLCLRLLAIVPCLLIMGKLLGVYGVLSSVAVAYAVLLVAVFLVCAMRKKSVKISPEDYLRLDDSFNIHPGDLIELEIRDLDDAALIAEQVQLFCRGHKLDSKKSNYAALALEEAAGLIYENNGNHPKLSIDIRVTIQNGELMMRIRDNGKSSIPFGEFNPEQSDDPCANIGLRIIQKTAKDIQYYHTMKINYTIITV